MSGLGLEVMAVVKRALPQEPEPRGPIERLAGAVGPWAPPAELKALLGAALDGLNVALCLHRVRDEGRLDPFAIPAVELDALIGLLCEARPAGSPTGLTVSFDDGYDDAAWYMLSRAPRYPDVEWLMFVCPRRSEERRGFSWDGEDSWRQLASLSTLLALQKLPNVSLGNHTNSHVRQHTLSDEQAEVEYRESFTDFARLFGGPRHFAFPFGTPGATFGPDHVAMLRGLGSQTIWSTERRPYLPLERHRGAVLPRFSVNGVWNHRQSALWLALLALKFRWAGSRFRY